LEDGILSGLFGELISQIQLVVKFLVLMAV